MKPISQAFAVQRFGAGRPAASFRPQSACPHERTAGASQLWKGSLPRAVKAVPVCSPSEAVFGQAVGTTVGAASSALGAYYGAQSQKQSLELQANLADINARMSESAAQATLLTGQREEQQR